MESFITAARGAGVGVSGGSVLRRLGESGPTPNLAMSSRPNMTPAEMAVAHASTMAKPPLQTFQGADLDVRPAPKSRTLLYVLAPVALFVGLGVGFLVLKPNAKPKGGGNPGLVTSVLPSASPTQAAVLPSASVQKPPDDVLVTVKCVPEHAGIYLGDERIGVAPGPVKLRRGADKVKLTLKADGFAPTDVELEPVDNTVLNAKLTKVGGGGIKKPVNTAGSSSGELEDPFKK
jgi:eukaryotic-like serine/threonine-protein kinase